jgi:molybdopterin converting factor small subunit
MAKVRFTPALKRFFPDLEEVNVNAPTLALAFQEVEHRFPGINDYIFNERGEVRQHMNIFIGDELIKDRIKLSDKIEAGEEILVFQALSGG